MRTTYTRSFYVVDTVSVHRVANGLALSRFFRQLCPAGIEGVILMLRRVQLGQRLLESSGVGCDLRVLHTVASGGKAGIGLLNLVLNSGKLASFEVRKLLFAARTRRRIQSCSLY